MPVSPHSEQSRRNPVALLTYGCLGLFILIFLGMQLLQSRYIYPRFTQLLIASTEEEALRIGNNLMRVVLQDHHHGELTISESLRTALDQAAIDYNLYKVKVFSASGETIYSTDQGDVGAMDNHDYFHTIVGKGEVYTRFVNKNTKSMDKVVARQDVVETYIPIVAKDIFVGAFELYYNITTKKEAMDGVFARTNGLLYGLTTLFIIVILGSATVLRRLMNERQKFEAQLYAQANKDSLTGLNNRRKFMELLKWEVERHLRYKMNVSLLMFDIDHFKIINDTYGHLAGDEVLKSIARVCEQVSRKTDLIARYGGEEFVILLPETQKKSAAELAERLRQTIKETITVYQGDKEVQIRVTVSIGVIDFADIQNLSTDSAIKRVDSFLYKAKESGRNRVFQDE